MKKISYYALILLLTFSACKSRSGKGQPETDALSVAVLRKQVEEAPLLAGNVALKEEDFGELIELKGVHQLFDEGGPIFKLSEPEVLIKDGYFLFQNRPSGGNVKVNSDGTYVRDQTDGKGLNSFFHWYRLPDFRYVTSMGLQGNGPDEFMFPHIIQGCGDATGTYIYENTTHKLYATDTTGVLKPILLPLTADENSDYYADRQFVMASRDTLYYVDNIRHGKAIFCTFQMKDSVVKEQIYDLSFSKKHRGWAAYIGDFAMSPSGNRIVYAYKYFRKILVMDKKANVIRELSFDNVGVDSKDNAKTLGPDNVTYYWGVSATDEYFFLTYSGRTPLQVGQENNKGDGYIFVEQYDWGGNPVARYRLDHWGNGFTDGKQFYLLSYVYDDPLFIYSLPAK